MSPSGGCRYRAVLRCWRYIDPLVGLGGEIVDQRAVRNLIRNIQRSEPRLLERGDDALLFEYIVVIFSRNGRKNHGHALMRRVALGQHIAERTTPSRRSSMGRRSVSGSRAAPRRSPRSLADHHHVDFAAVRHAVARHAETKIAGSLGICVALRPTVERKTDIIDHVDGENMIVMPNPGWRAYETPAIPPPRINAARAPSAARRRNGAESRSLSSSERTASTISGT